MAINDTKELRGDAPADLVRALDALAMGDDMSRTAYINKVLEAHVKFECHRLSLKASMLRGNPYFPDAARSATPHTTGGT